MKINFNEIFKTKKVKKITDKNIKKETRSCELKTPTASQY